MENRLSSIWVVRILVSLLRSSSNPSLVLSLQIKHNRRIPRNLALRGVNAGCSVHKCGCAIVGHPICWKRWINGEKLRHFTQYYFVLIPSCMCPKMWYLGFTLSTTCVNRILEPHISPSALTSWKCTCWHSFHECWMIHFIDYQNSIGWTMWYENVCIRWNIWADLFPPTDIWAENLKCCMAYALMGFYWCPRSAMKFKAIDDDAGIFQVDAVGKVGLDFLHIRMLELLPVLVIWTNNRRIKGNVSIPRNNKLDCVR